jgi:hypothetical protein
VSLSWKPEKFGIIALATCVVELIGIWIPMAIVLRNPYASAPWLLRILGLLYLAGLLSIPVAIVGLFRDEQRVLALFALIFGVANIILCGLPLVG